MKETLLRSAQTVDWITIILLCSVVSLALAKSFFYGRFNNFMILPFNNKYILMYNKKDKLSHWFNIFLSLFQFLNFGVFLYLADAIFNISEHEKSPLYFYTIVALLVLFFIGKILLHFINAFIFNITGIISEFLFKNITYLNYSGFFMFIANILLTFVLKDSKTVVYASALLIILINGIGWIIVIRNHQKLITNNFFYFILYLCALEITPLVLIGDYFKD